MVAPIYLIDLVLSEDFSADQRVLLMGLVEYFGNHIALLDYGEADTLTGLASRKPVTEDFVPLLPWFGVMLWGYAAGRWLLARRPALLTGRLPEVLQPLAVLGRWSLSFYMLHQPVLIGGLMAVVALRGS